MDRGIHPPPQPLRQEEQEEVEEEEEEEEDYEEEEVYSDNPLLHACATGEMTQVTRLVHRGVDIECQDSSNGQTPLMVVAEVGYLNIVQFLLQQGARIDHPN